jgi:8-oxo-dGTP pyrophosphatase MutT (NUDIX family)
MSGPRPRRSQTEIAARYRGFDVLRHRMTDEAGRPLRDAFTIDFPDWVSVVPVTESGQILLVRQYRHGIDAETLEIPGGVIDQNEKPEAAGLRELREETGYEAASVVPMGFVHPNPPLQGNRHHMFLATGAWPAGSPRFDQDEHCEVVVASPDEVRRFMRDGTMTHVLVLIALHRAFEIVSSGGS